MKRLTLVVLAAMMACTTQFKMLQEWTDPNAQKGCLSSALVIAVAADDLTRQVSENAFAYQLKEKGVNAVASHKVIPQGGKLDRAAVEEAVKRLGLRTVLITRLVDFEQVQHSFIVAPGAAGAVDMDWYNDYSNCYVYVSGMTATLNTDNRTTVLETKVFDVPAGRMIWDGQVRVRYSGANAQALRPFVTYMTDRLKGSKLIP